MKQHLVPAIFRTTLCVLMFSSVMLAQPEAPRFTVADAIDNASHLGSREVQVYGHFWWGKEGSMIYDSGHKAILILQYSNAFNAKHSYREFFPIGKTRKSDYATITGQLHAKENGQFVLVADDIKFAENPR